MIRALLVDDEEPARLRLRSLLSEHPDLEIVGEAEDGEEALQKITEFRPDLVFLDIQMPGKTGLEVLAALPPPRPRIIFCTAFDQYAINAFEHNAVDYLLKPLNRVRLGKAIHRVRKRLEESERFRREWQDASRTQARLLPREFPRRSTLDYRGNCRTASGVGGDYFDFLPVGENHLGIAIGDVSGKGMFAGLLMASLQAQIQSRINLLGNDPENLFREINNQMLSSTHSNQYATLFYAFYDDRTRKLTYCNAGHLPPLLLRPGNSPADGYRARKLTATGPPVGLLEDAEYTVESLDLQTGDILLGFTDGLTEARNPQLEEFGEERLESLVLDLQNPSPADLVDRIFRQVDRFRSAAPQQDDMTLVVAKVL